ncbi:hypothetical protein ACHAXR_004892, partial [Thalassiosira sp. AJA248-18]
MNAPTDADAVVAIAATANNNESNPNANPKAPPLQKPSYYIESFHEHFFPHPNDDAVDSSTLPPRKKLSIAQRYATSMARRPKTHLSIAFVIAVVLSFIGLRFGDFNVAVDNAGWWSRGTMISNRATQETIVSMNRNDLFYDSTGEFWEELQTVVQPNWQGDESPTSTGADDEEEEEVDESMLASVCSGEWYGSKDMVRADESNLFTVWKTMDAEEKDPEKSALNPDAMYDLCMAEQNTLKSLESSDSCYKCSGISPDDDGKCIQPYSLVLMARLHLVDNDIEQLNTLAESITCDMLRSSWTPNVQRQFTIALKTCVNWSIRMTTGDRNNTITIQDTTITVTNPCPLPITFLPSVVDDYFPTSDPPIVRYSSSYYATKGGSSAVSEMYEESEKGAYDRSDGSPLSGVYETTDEEFQTTYADAIVGRDMTLAVGSA